MRVAGGLRGGKKGGLLMRVSGAGEEEGALDDGILWVIRALQN